MLKSLLSLFICAELEKKTQPAAELEVTRPKTEPLPISEEDSAQPQVPAFVAVKTEPIETIELLDSSDEEDGEQKTALTDPLGSGVVLTQQNPIEKHGM